MGLRKREKNENFLDTNAFIKELAERAGFTIADTKIFMDNFTMLIADSIEQNVDVDLRGLFHLYTQNIKPFRGVNAFLSKKTGETVYQDFPASKRVVVKISLNMKDILRDPDKKKVKNTKALREKEREIE